MMKEMLIRLKSSCPLIMHNGQTADPLNWYAKELKKLSSNKKKTEEIYKEMARLEWRASLYTNADGRLVLPNELIEATIHNGAKAAKKGKDFKAGVFVNEDALLDIGNKKTADELIDEQKYRFIRAVRVNQARVMRTRAIFNQWQTQFPVIYDDEVVSEDDVVRAIAQAGTRVGFCDWRPKYGRFAMV